MADVLDETLAHFGMTGVFYAVSELTAPWGIGIPPIRDTVMFHLLTEGESFVVTVEGTQATVPAGELVLVPHGAGHVVGSDAGEPGVPLWNLPREEITERYERMRIDGGGAPARLICGAVEFTDLAVGRLMASLPALLVADQHDAWLRSTVEVMAAECRTVAPGSAVVTARLADVLVVRAIRDWLRRERPARGWLAGLRDPHLGRSLAAFQAAPERAWDLPALAAEAGLSRSAFAARFTDVLGEPPMAVVASWRMDLAAKLLEDGELSAGRVAARVGYTSEAAFNRAFQRVKGVTPGRWRRPSPLEDAAPAALTAGA
jgi:AraC-like DNA-binding protein